MSPGCGDISGAQGVNAGVVVQVEGKQVVAGSLRAGDGLSVQCLGRSRVGEGAAQQVVQQAHAEQDVIAELRARSTASRA
jgi:hypothetical protein